MADEGLTDRALRLAIDQAPDAVVCADDTGRIVFLNPAAERAFGHTNAKARGQELTLLMPERFHEAHRRGFRRYLDTNEARVIGRTVELAGRRSDGTEFPIELAISEAHEEGADRVFVAIIRDITERKSAEATSHEIERLKEVADFRARFLNVAAHELKTPLTPIRMQVRILQERLKDAEPDVAKSLRILGRGVDRLQTLMADVLDAARTQADRLTVRHDTVSLSDIAKEAMENYAAVAQEVGVKLASSIQPGINVVGDSERLLQVMTNLLSNAMKFTPAGGGVRLTLSAEGEWAQLKVGDTGRGMSEEQLGRLFEPFAQVHPDAQATLKGTGLGLYITRAIVQQHGGEISIISGGTGEGTTAVVSLPTTQGAAAPVVAKSKSRSMEQRLREMV